MKSSLLSCLLLLLVLLGTTFSEKKAVPLATGESHLIVGTTSQAAIDAGKRILDMGGTAADAACATALAQVVECGGCYVSAAGIMSVMYYDNANKQVRYLNACFHVPLNETEPATIPTRETPSGRATLVPGFMSGIQNLHDRFGNLPRTVVFSPAIDRARNGFPIGKILGAMIPFKKDMLSRFPETKRVFFREDGRNYEYGEHFSQPEMAETLRKVAEQGASYMYTGDWGKKFVAAVQREGGKITEADMRNYTAYWEDPLSAKYGEYEVFVPGLSSGGGPSMQEAVRMMTKVNFKKSGHYTKSAESLYWMMQISHNQVLGFIPHNRLEQFEGLRLLPFDRTKPETTEAIWQKMQAGSWPFTPEKKIDMPTNHSDGIVVVDKFGNWAAITHTINTENWGSTGLFVDGVSIPDAACYQQKMLASTGPGRRFADPMCPIIVLQDGKPILASSAIGSGLHQKSMQILSSVLDFDYDAQEAVEAPAFMLASFASDRPTGEIEENTFDKQLIEQVQKRGQEVESNNNADSSRRRGYWVGIQYQPGMKRYIAAGTRQLPSVAAGQ